MVSLIHSTRSAVARALNPYLTNVTNRRIQGSTLLTPMETTDPKDVFIAGYPRSGNTWFQNLVAGAIYGAHPRFVPDTVVQDLVPDVDARRYYRRYLDVAFFKTHYLPQPQYKRVVYLMRDGRDAMVSYYHFMADRFDPSITLERTIREAASLPYGSWQDHVRAWMNNPYGAEICVIKYEDLQHDPVAEMQRFLAFVGIEREAAWIEEITRGASFDNMRQKEVTQGWEDQNWPADRFFVRRGEVGSFLDEMPADLLREFETAAGDVLDRFGYQRAEALAS